jgi:hypothetical protein
MKLEDRQRDRVIDKLLEGIQRVKSEILERKRVEDDYPISINAAMEFLSQEGEQLLGNCPDASHQRSKSHRSAKGSLLQFLKSGKWEHEKVRRKRFKNGPSYSYQFYLPDDDHFVKRPRSDKEYVRLLFMLERKQGSGGMSDKQARRTASDTNKESFESRVRRKYDELIKKSRGAAYVRIPELRREMNVTDEAFLLGLLDMRDKGQVVLSKHGFAAGLSQEDRDASIELSPGEYYYYMTLREES